VPAESPINGARMGLASFSRRLIHSLLQTRQTVSRTLILPTGRLSMPSRLRPIMTPSRVLDLNSRMSHLGHACSTDLAGWRQKMHGCRIGVGGWMMRFANLLLPWSSGIYGRLREAVGRLRPRHFFSRSATSQRGTRMSLLPRSANRSNGVLLSAFSGGESCFGISISFCRVASAAWPV
jgi:hypothetical protein